MHYHCEIILPPDTSNIEVAVEQVMKQFDENMENNDEYSDKHAFWDFYVIGGRFAGRKQMRKYDKGKLDLFYAWLKENKVTVSGLVCGKEELSPASQIPMVDAKWNELFPQDSGVMVACPIFNHSNDQYGRNGNGMIEGDISKLGDSKDVKCDRVVFSGPSYDSETKERTGPLEAVFMLCDDQWNGVNHMPIKWDGTIQDAMNQWMETLSRYAEGYRDQMTPTDDWICVTVDYHS